MSRLCLVYVSSLYCFDIVLIIFLFSVRRKKDYQYCNHVKIFLYQVYTNIAYVPPTYRRVKNYEFS